MVFIVPGTYGCYIFQAVNGLYVAGEGKPYFFSLTHADSVVVIRGSRKNFPFGLLTPLSYYLHHSLYLWYYDGLGTFFDWLIESVIKDEGFDFSLILAIVKGGNL